MELSAAEMVLRELGVTDPSEIDIEAIAYHLGAEVRYRPLDGCEALIFGAGNKAVITVNTRSPPRRRRFSVAHELGHWKHHRGRMLVCSKNEIGGKTTLAPVEKVADAYAAELLMPGYLFNPVARAYPRFTFQAVRAIADIFNTSRTATALRLIDTRHSPAMLVCHGPSGRRWFYRCRDVPARWFPQDSLDPDSSAFRVLFGGYPDDPLPIKIGADAWFDRRGADELEIHEQTIRTADDEILTLLLLNDERMLEDEDSMPVPRRR
jgi:hypothetical protein